MFNLNSSSGSLGMGERVLDALCTNVMVADADLKIVYVNPSLARFLAEAEAELRDELPRFSMATLIGSNVDVFHKNPSHQRTMLAALERPHRVTIHVGRRAFDLLVTPLVKQEGLNGFVVEWSDAKARLLNLDYAGQISAIGRSQAVVEFSVDGVVLDANANFLHLTGYTLDEILGKSHRLFVEPSAYDADAHGAFWERLKHGDHQTGEFERIGKDGRKIWIQGSYDPILDHQGRVTKVVKFATDVTQDRLRRMEVDGRLQAISRVQAIVEFAPDGEILTANDRFLELFGYELDEIVTKHHRMFVEPTFAVSQDYQDFWSTLKSGRYISSEFRRIGRGGRSIWIQASYNPIFDLSGRVIKVVKFATDITERRRIEFGVHSRLVSEHVELNRRSTEVDPGELRALTHHEAQLTYLAFHDALTGLENHAAFLSALGSGLDDARGRRCKLAVVIVDLDRFKEVNDRFGHAAGDHVLKEMARRLKAAVGPDACVARFGGDEFAVFKIFDDRAQLEATLQAMRTLLLTPVVWDHGDLLLGASIGVALHPDDGETAERLLGKADLAMYRSKAANNRSICYYTQEMDDADRYQKALASGLRSALQNGEFSVFYQVQTSVQTGRIVGYEALLRWNHPDLGPVSPADFIPLAEQSGGILQIGRWVLQEACLEAAGWDEPLRIAVNLSAVQFSDAGLIDVVRQTLVCTSLAPERLELEVTETALVEDTVAALHVLRQLKALGVKIAMDDFGTGYSSLSTLSTFPFDKIKIDRSFLLEADARPQARAVIRTILGLGRSLDMTILAEGVETGEQLAMLRAEGCQEAQGYLLGRPALNPRANLRTAQPISAA